MAFTIDVVDVGGYKKAAADAGLLHGRIPTDCNVWLSALRRLVTAVSN